MSGLFGDLLTENDHLSWRVAIFYDDVKDFISVQDNMLEWWQGGMVGPIKYQTVNYGHVVNKGAELSGKDNILFIRNSVNGRIEARYRKVGIELNAKLHKN